MLVTGLFIITFTLQAFTIPSSSMENTLLIGDHVFVDRILLAPATKWIDKLIPYREPRHGDVFVFLSPAEPGLYVVKRVIGLPGDHIHLQDGVVYRNGEKLNEPYVIRCNQNRAMMACASIRLYRDNFPSVPAPDYEDVTQEWRAELPILRQEWRPGGAARTASSPWATTATSASTAATGALCPSRIVIGRPMFIYWSFVTPRDEYERQEHRRPHRVAVQHRASTSSIRRAGPGCSTWCTDAAPHVTADDVGGPAGRAGAAAASVRQREPLSQPGGRRHQPRAWAATLPSPTSNSSCCRGRAWCSPTLWSPTIPAMAPSPCCAPTPSPPIFG